VANSVLLVQDFTADQPRLSRAIGQLVPTGGTAIWDAVAFASRKLARFPDKGPVARALVVVSDGKDNASRVTLKEAIQAAQNGEVFVCTVSVPGPSNGNERPTNADTVGESAMRLLAEQAGGAALVTISLKNLDHSLDEIQQVLRSRYLISYKPALFHSNGEHRTIDISAEKSGRKLHVYARKGYFARTTSANN
jgi:VWFA-related protein